MPVLTFPVPVYTTTTSTPSPFTTNKRALSTTSPGTTDNTATGVTGGLTGVHDFFRPLATFTATTGSGTSAPSPATIDYGWVLPISPTLVSASNGVAVAAGTWTVPVHYSRPGGVLTADVPGTITAILVRVNSDATVNLSEVGRSAATNITATTTEQSINLSITGVLTEFAPGECLMLLLYFDRAGAVTSDTFRIHTNSTTAFRITAAPNYTQILYSGGSSDAVASASGVAASTASTVSTSNASATVDGQSSTVLGTTVSSAGIADAQGVTTAITATIGTSDGTATAQSVGAGIASTVADSVGSAVVQGSVGSIGSGVFDSQGQASSNALASSVSGTIGTASGQSASDFKITKILGVVGTVDIGAGGGVTNVYRPLFLWDD